jgi:uncharacterized Zn finger protein
VRCRAAPGEQLREGDRKKQLLPRGHAAGLELRLQWIVRLSCDCGDYGSGGGLWCKHHAALISALIRKLNGNGFLYLKLLGVDVYELAKADAEAEQMHAPKRRKIGPASGSQDDPICL